MLTRRTIMAFGASALAMAPGALAAAAGVKTGAKGGAAAKPIPVVESPRALHQRLICLDTHLDTPINFARPGWNVMQRHSFEADLSQVDYPRMVQGGLDGGFFAIYTPQGPLTDEGYQAARDAALLRAVAIRETVARHEDAFQLAFNADDAARIAASGKRIVYQSMENAYPLGHDVTLLRSFYALGVRMAGPVHFTNNQLADSATDPGGGTWGGLSPMGRDFVAQANRLGIICDVSHSSDNVFDQMIELSKAPIIASHSGCRAVHNHPRNLDDARIKKLAAAGGSIQVNSLSSYLIDTPHNPERDAAMAKVYEKLRKIGSQTPEKASALVTEAYRLENGGEASFPPRPTTYSASGAFAVLGDLLRENGLDRARIGVDLEFMPAADFAILEEALPEIEWVDGSEVLRRLRMVKSAREIDCVRRACALADAG
ncbi:MAG: membrane dipeptidase, partial [Alphaproteobacteria bacterium]|nr:membrane dipeptidase [Alphaproteobacteria bacterium]